MAYKIVVAHDYTDESDHAVSWAADLIRRAGGSLVLVHVILDPPAPIKRMPMIAALRPGENAEQSRERLEAIAKRAGVEAEIDVVETSDAGPGIVARALLLEADLLVIGASVPGRGAIGRAILGSVVDHVVWHAHCPVVTVRGLDG